MAKFLDIKGFVFDLDGVITDTSVFHSQAWHQIADKVGGPMVQRTWRRIKGNQPDGLSWTDFKSR